MKHLTLPALLVCCLLTAGAFAADEKKAPDKKPKPVNTTCPVTDEKVDPDVATTTYKGKTIGFCCPDCIKDFNKDPAKYMKKVEAEEAKNKKADKDKKDAKKGEQPAADSSKAVNKFCAVEKENAVDPTVATTTYKGKTIGFCCEDCIKKFDRDPDAFMASLK
jgi:YHS domain-containing protein